MKFYEKTWFIVLMLILIFPLGLFLMWRYQKFSVSNRLIITTLSLLFFGWALTSEKTISAEQCKKNISKVETRLATLQSKYDKLTLEGDEYKKEIATLTSKVESADKNVSEKVKAAEEKIRKESEDKINKAIADAEKRADEEVAEIKAEAEQQVAAAIAEADAQTEESTLVEPDREESTDPQFFQNCTDLRKTHPGGVASDHPDYQPKMDRDKDGWACE